MSTTQTTQTPVAQIRNTLRGLGEEAKMFLLCVAREMETPGYVAKLQADAEQQKAEHRRQAVRDCLRRAHAGREEK